MAIATLTTVWTAGDRNGITTWDTAPVADTFEPFQHKMVLANAMFGVEGLSDSTVELHGSLDGVNYYQLDDRDGTPISFGSDGIIEVRAMPPYYKPVSSGGTDAAIICTLHHAKIYA